MTSSIALKHRVAVSPEVCLPATIAGISWCHAHRDDIALLVEVAAADSFEFDFDEPGIDPVQAIAFDLQGRAVAYGLVAASRKYETLAWVSLEGMVHSEHRGKGIGSVLLNWQQRRGLRILSAIDAGLPALLQ
ncbi:GNAT family N-acetyltransferase [Cupriavidus basilensis]|uniref:GNAT family N-acetyltransferase n=1 Tax=Cupriavidus basilensis TaxID=68895 RepID=A0ABT6AYM2_9BURK|nr:GNAT family N-acetyltransferase [Cupriavidus basilensis]MDF3837726.1 GNAT family N-acetyltransferase [Cupriavidus basilensis]